MDTIVADAKKIYETTELRFLGEVISVTSLWQSKVNAAHSAIEMASQVETVIGYAQTHKHSGFDHRVNAKESLLQRKHAEIKERFPEFDLASSGLAESPLSIKDTLGEMDGVSVSNIFYWHLEAYLSCIYKLCDKPKKVIEVGGGYGALARLFTLGSPDTEYVIVDLPESLFFSYVFINANFPEGHNVKFVPVQNYLEQQTADIMITQGTMQEMPDIMVKTYMNWLASGNFKNFYSLNYPETPFEFGPEWEEVFREDDAVIVTLDSPKHWRELCLRRKTT